MIELMVSIGIIGVLLSLTFSAISGTRIQASQVKSLANTRVVASDLQAFADSYRTWPFASKNDPFPAALLPYFHEYGLPDFDPGTIFIPWWPAPLYLGTSDHWSFSRLWPGFVAAVAPWEEHYEAWVSPGRVNTTLGELNNEGRPQTPSTSYVYSNSFIASPRLWSGSAAANESLIAPTTPSMVEFPSNKVLVWDGDLAYLPRTPKVVDGFFNHLTPMAFVDQHAEALMPQDATEGIANPLNHGDDRRLHNTPAGVLGRDY